MAGRQGNQGETTPGESITSARGSNSNALRALLAAFAGGAVAIIGGATALGGTPPADQVPTVSHLAAKPSKFCAKKSRSCSHPGTTVRFTLSTAARVRADIRPRSANLGPFVEFVKHFGGGANSIPLKDSRLTPGRWTLRLQGTNHVGSGGPNIVDVHVVKHG